MTFFEVRECGGHEGKRVAVLDWDAVEATIVNAGPVGAVLLHKEPGPGR